MESNDKKVKMHFDQKWVDKVTSKDDGFTANGGELPPMPKKKDKGERIRGRDLKITERDIFGSLPFFKRVSAWLFGGVYGMRDPESKMPNVVVVYIPPAPMRFYYKHFWKPRPPMKGELHSEQK